MPLFATRPYPLDLDVPTGLIPPSLLSLFPSLELPSPAPPTPSQKVYNIEELRLAIFQYLGPGSLKHCAHVNSDGFRVAVETLYKVWDRGRREMEVWNERQYNNDRNIYTPHIHHLRLSPHETLHPTSIILTAITHQLPNLRSVTFPIPGKVGGECSVHRAPGEGEWSEMELRGVGLDSDVLGDERYGLKGTGQGADSGGSEPWFRLRRLECVDVAVFSAYCNALIRSDKTPSDALPSLLGRKHLLRDLSSLTLPRLKLSDAGTVLELLRGVRDLREISLDFDEPKIESAAWKRYEKEWESLWRYIGNSSIQAVDISRMGRKSPWGYRVILEYLRLSDSIRKVRVSGNFLLKLNESEGTDDSLILNQLSKPHRLPLDWTASISFHAITFIIDHPTSFQSRHSHLSSNPCRSPERIGQFLAELCHPACAIHFEAGARPKLDVGWVERVRRRRNEIVRERRGLRRFGEGWRKVEVGE